MENLKQVTDEQLLSAFIPEASAKGLLHDYSNLYNVFRMASDEQLKSYQGIWEAKLHKMQCLREMVSRIALQKVKVPRGLNSPYAAMQYFKFLEDKPVEEFWAVFLNTKNQPLGCRCITIGTVDSSLAQPREVFSAALQHLATSIIVAHNHPSGDAEPSSEDLAVTRNLISAGELLHIPLLDHVIIGKYGDKSIREQHPHYWDD